jgi:hypothetical protein
MQGTMQGETTCMVQLICYQTSVEYSFRRDSATFESMAVHSYISEAGRWMSRLIWNASLIDCICRT